MKLVPLLILGLSLNTFAKDEGNLKRTKGLYSYKGIETQNNNYSSAPSPICECDKDADVQDCPGSFQGDYPDGICYDEFIPAGSRGWAWGAVYKLVEPKKEEKDNSTNSL